MPMDLAPITGTLQFNWVFLWHRRSREKMLLSKYAWICKMNVESYSSPSFYFLIKWIKTQILVNNEMGHWSNVMYRSINRASAIKSLAYEKINYNLSNHVMISKYTTSKTNATLSDLQHASKYRKSLHYKFLERR